MIAQNKTVAQKSQFTYNSANCTFPHLPNVDSWQDEATAAFTTTENTFLVTEKRGLQLTEKSWIISLYASPVT